MAKKGRENIPTRRQIGRYTALKRLHKSRWYISFSVTGSYDPKTRKYRKAAWPILFTSEEAAQAAMDSLPIFANSEAINGRGKIKSVCIERITLP